MPARLVTMKRLSAPWSDASTRAMTRRSAVPGLGGVGELAVAADLRGPALDPPQRRLLGEVRDAPEQHRVAGQAEDVADAVALAPAHGLGPAVVAVAAHQDVDRRPAGADAADHVAQHQRHLGAVRRLAGAQDDRHRLAGGRLVDVDRQEAAAVVVGVEQRRAAGRRAPGPRCRRCRARCGCGTCSKLSQNSSTMAAIMRLSAVTGQVLEPAHGRLRAQDPLRSRAGGRPPS